MPLFSPFIPLHAVNNRIEKFSSVYHNYIQFDGENYKYIAAALFFIFLTVSNGSLKQKSQFSDTKKGM
jgi:hypothetical protein